MKNILGKEFRLLPTIIRLGAKKFGCKRQGICEVKQIYKVDLEMNLPPNYVYAYLRFNSDLRLGDILFIRSSISYKDRMKYLSGDLFFFSDHCTFNLNLFGGKKTFNIRKGRYVLTTMGEVSRVDLNFRIASLTANSCIRHHIGQTSMTVQQAI